MTHPRETTIEQFLPGLDPCLGRLSLMELERPRNPGIAAYREHGGAALLIPKELGGSGATPLDALRIQRAIASRSPSLAIAATMHNFSVATLVEYCFYGDYTVELLRTISSGRLLVASGFAEGRSGTSILAPSMTAVAVEGGYRVNGSKKPCSLSRSMDLLTASVAVVEPGDGAGRRAVAIIPAAAEGLGRKSFWKSWVLAGAESDQLTLTDVFVPEDHLFFPEVEDGMDAVEAGGFLWFELLVAASYLGVASGLADRVFDAARGEPTERVQMAIDLEGAAAALEAVARSMMAGERGEGLLAQALLVRFAVQQAIERVSARAAELLGGMAFVGSSDVAYLYAASRALAFHPPSRLSVAPALDAYLRGQPLEVA